MVYGKVSMVLIVRPIDRLIRAGAPERVAGAIVVGANVLWVTLVVQAALALLTWLLGAA